MIQRHTPVSSAPPADSAPIQQILYPCGVGIDTHSKFIQVCILFQHLTGDAAGSIRRIEHEFQTTWPAIQQALAWVLTKLGSLATPADLRYCIESTGT